MNSNDHVSGTPGVGMPKILGIFFFLLGGGISRISCMKFGER